MAKKYFRHKYDITTPQHFYLYTVRHQHDWLAKDLSSNDLQLQNTKWRRLSEIVQNKSGKVAIKGDIF